jgi:uncharacterized protein YcbK (DUF882 family)
MKRRTFLLFGATSIFGFVLTQTAPAWALSRISGQNSTKTLSFCHTHTHEQLTITYAKAGKYDPVALQKISTYLRDFRTEEVHPIDPALLDILWAIQQKMCCTDPYEIISGYRSPVTNEKLRKAIKKVAQKSLHMKGMAVDVRLRGQNTRLVQNCATSLKAGGVGYYADSDFVHIDTGMVRTW